LPVSGLPARRRAIAVSRSVPAEVELSCTMIVVLAPAARLPSVQVSGSPVEQEP